MDSVLSEKEIKQLLAMPKRFSSNPAKWRSCKRKSSNERCAEVLSDSGERFRIIVRENRKYPVNFSVIFGYAARIGSLIHLKRYNGKHEHRNRIEKETIYGFHIHTATERYQKRYKDTDTYAESTKRFCDVQTALQCLYADCGLTDQLDAQLSLIDVLNGT